MNHAELIHDRRFGYFGRPLIDLTVDQLQTVIANWEEAAQIRAAARKLLAAAGVAP